MKNKNLDNTKVNTTSTERKGRFLLKVCGMKYEENIMEIAQLQPDFMGFIFYNKSPRSFKGNLPKIPKNIKKVGVFVNVGLKQILEKIKKYHLHAVQLHGSESPEFCSAFRNVKPETEIIKVFSIKDTFDFNELKPYEAVCDYYLFDTKGKNPGGNGYFFNWEVLENYPSSKPYFLSGGIGLEEIEKLDTFFKSKPARYCVAIDVNSKFETAPGLKDVRKLNEFYKSLGL